MIGANHRSSSLALRDRLFLDEPEVIPFLDKLKDDGVEQCLVVSTCDRVEVHCVDHNPARAHDLIVARLAERGLPSAARVIETPQGRGARDRD